MAAAASRRFSPGNLLLVLGSLAGTVLLCDLALLLVFGPVRVVENFYEPDARFGYHMRPGVEFRFASPYNGYEAKVRTNSRGLRDDEVQVPKPPGVLRVLLIGDSMTAGLEVDKNATFEAVSERLLSRTRRVEVINAGVRGYNLDNIVGWLRSEGLALEPDLVVYFFTDNDLTTEARWSPEGSDISRGFTIGGLRGRLAAYSHLTYRFEILRERLRLRRLRDDPGKPGKAFIPGGLLSCFTHKDYAAQMPFVLTARRIEQLDALCRTHGTVFWLATAPQREEIEAEAQERLRAQVESRFGRLDFDGVTQYLDWVAASLACPRLDATADFRARIAADGTFWFHHDGHLNPRGHRLLGEVLARQIAASPVFQSRP